MGGEGVLYRGRGRRRWEIFYGGMILLAGRGGRGHGELVLQGRRGLQRVDKYIYIIYIFARGEQCSSHDHARTSYEPAGLA